MPTAKWLNAVSILLVLGAAGSRAGVLAQTHDAGADRQQLQGNVKAARTDDMPVQIFDIVDPTGPMQVNANVHETVIEQFYRGLAARIRVDALPGELLAGTVSEVAVLPDPVQFFTGFINTYTTKIQIDHGPAGVRPGMTAQVEILVNN